MKRFALAALAVVTLLGLTGCDIFGSTTTDTPAAGTNLSKWWIKGSFDGWKGTGDQDVIKSTDTIHYLSIDSLNPNLLTYEISVPAGLKKFTYEFVVMNDAAAGSRVNFQASSSTAIADNTSYTLVASTTTGAKNANFVASASTYTVQLDIASPAAPKVKLIPGSTASVYYTAAELASGMKVAGGKLSMGWTETAGTFDAATKTVTWTDVGVTDKSSPVYFHSDVGYFKAATDVASPTAIDGTVTAPLSGSNDFNLTGVPFKDAKYKFEVIIDPTQTSFAQAFTFKATLTAGSTSWTYAPWTTVYFAGSTAEIGDWNNGGAFSVSAPVDATTKIATIQITASGAAEEFKICPENVWGKDKNFGAVDVTGSTVPIVSADGTANGNLKFATTATSKYTITIDFSSATYTDTGVPKVTVTTP